MLIIRYQPTWRLDLLKVGGDAWDRPVGERILESGNKGLRREDAQISGTKVLQNLKLVVLKYYKANELPVE